MFWFKKRKAEETNNIPTISLTVELPENGDYLVDLKLPPNVSEQELYTFMSFVFSGLSMEIIEQMNNLIGIKKVSSVLELLKIEAKIRENAQEEKDAPLLRPSDGFSHNEDSDD